MPAHGCRTSQQTPLRTRRAAARQSRRYGSVASHRIHRYTLRTPPEPCRRRSLLRRVGLPERVVASLGSSPNTRGVHIRGLPDGYRMAERRISIYGRSNPPCACQAANARAGRTCLRAYATAPSVPCGADRVDDRYDRDSDSDGDLPILNRVGHAPSGRACMRRALGATAGQCDDALGNLPSHGQRERAGARGENVTTRCEPTCEKSWVSVIRA